MQKEVGRRGWGVAVSLTPATFLTHTNSLCVHACMNVHACICYLSKGIYLDSAISGTVFLYIGRRDSVAPHTNA